MKRLVIKLFLRKAGIQYGALTANLIRTVQEQQEIIEDLNKRLEKIESMLLNAGK